MLNHIVLMGRLTRDPELRYTQSQIPVASFRLAVDRDFGGRDGGERQTDFIDIVAWRSTAEFVSKYFTKGSMAAVVDTVLAKNGNARICIAAIALESLSAAIAALTAHGLSAEVTQLAVSRTRPAGRLHLLTANNPIFLITGERK